MERIELTESNYLLRTRIVEALKTATPEIRAGVQNIAERMPLYPDLETVNDYLSAQLRELTERQK
jgi:hypothetical protein